MDYHKQEHFVCPIMGIIIKRLYKPRNTTLSDAGDYRATGEYTIGGAGMGIIGQMIKTTPEWTVGKIQADI